VSVVASGQRSAVANAPADVPEELRAGVAALIKDEPVWPLEEAEFSHEAQRERPLTIARILAPEWRGLMLALFLVAIETAALQAGPLLTQLGIDRGILAGDLAAVVWVAAAYCASVVVTAAATGVRLAWTGRLSQRMLFDLRVRVFRHQQRLSIDFYTREKAGVIMTRMTSDIEQLNELFRDGFVQLAVQGLTLIIVTVVLFALNTKLALITVLGVLPPLSLLSTWFRSASDRGYQRARDGIAHVLSDLSESLAGIRVITSHNRQIHNIFHHRNLLGDFRAANNSMARIGGLYLAGSEGLGLLGQAAVLLIGGRMVLHGQLSVGDLTAFLLYLVAFFTPIQTLTQFYTQYQQGKAATIKLCGLLSEQPSVREAPDACPLPPIEGEIRFESVTFAYGGQGAEPVLRDIDLTIAAGETFALVGPTGAGKSTIAKLVTRFYDPQRGRVLIDGHDLRDTTLQSLRHQVGVVPQEPFLFPGSLRDNIAFGRPDATDADVVEAIEAVGLAEIVTRLPVGINSQVSWATLSAGERQLLALARTFLYRPRIVVLDEATSSLDLQSERRVERALDVLLAGRTAIIIAHRLSTAMRSDRIAVIKGGRIAETGSHHDLVTLGGHYAQMFDAWRS
jgi:ATP-binding cassette, subfamily B, bacterial